jgi:hypothetical protein
MRELISIGSSRPSSAETQPDAGKLANMLKNMAFERHRNIICEDTLRGPGIMAQVVAEAKKHGYEAQLFSLAVHRQESILGIYMRYEVQMSRSGEVLFDSLAAQNHYANPFQALEKGRELTPRRLDDLVTVGIRSKNGPKDERRRLFTLKRSVSGKRPSLSYPPKLKSS